MARHIIYLFIIVFNILEHPNISKSFLFTLYHLTTQVVPPITMVTNKFNVEIF